MTQPGKLFKYTTVFPHKQLLYYHWMQTDFIYQSYKKFGSDTLVTLLYI